MQGHGCPDVTLCMWRHFVCVGITLPQIMPRWWFFVFVVEAQTAPDSVIVFVDRTAHAGNSTISIGCANRTGTAIRVTFCRQWSVHHVSHCRRGEGRIYCASLHKYPQTPQTFTTNSRSFFNTFVQQELQGWQQIVCLHLSWHFIPHPEHAGFKSEQNLLQTQHLTAPRNDMVPCDRPVKSVKK